MVVLGVCFGGSLTEQREVAPSRSVKVRGVVVVGQFVINFGWTKHGFAVDSARSVAGEILARHVAGVRRASKRPVLRLRIPRRTH